MNMKDEMPSGCEYLELDIEADQSTHFSALNDEVALFEETEGVLGVAMALRKRCLNGEFDVEILAEDQGEKQLLASAVKLLYTQGSISTSLIQRRLNIGYGRAARIIDELTEKQVILLPETVRAVFTYYPLLTLSEAVEVIGLQARRAEGGDDLL